MSKNYFIWIHFFQLNFSNAILFSNIFKLMYFLNVLYTNCTSSPSHWSNLWPQVTKIVKPQVISHLNRSYTVISKWYNMKYFNFLFWFFSRFYIIKKTSFYSVNKELMENLKSLQNSAKLTPNTSLRSLVMVLGKRGCQDHYGEVWKIFEVAIRAKLLADKIK